MASFRPRNILLFGATGNIGSFILDAILAARGEFDRIAIFTSQATATAKKDFLDNLKRTKNVEVLVGDLQDEDAVRKAYDGMSLLSASHPYVANATINNQSYNALVEKKFPT